MRLINAPGALCGVALETRRWRHFEGELVIECRGLDGLGVFIPARWTDLPRAPGSDRESSLGVIAMRMAGVAWARSSPACASAVRPARERLRETEVTMSSQQMTLEVDDARTSTVAVWDALPAEPRMLLVATLAELVARMLEAERDE